MKYFFILGLALLSLSNSYAISRPDGHAPIGIMGDHGHSKGDWMLSVRQMQMQMEKLFDDSSEIDVFDETNFMMSPKSMTMNMTMLGVMYGVSDQWTLMLMLNYVDNKMDVERKSGGEDIEMSSFGIGDSAIGGIYTLFENESSRLVMNLGFSLPTGSVSRDRSGSRLGYPMQLGAGSSGVYSSLNYAVFKNWGSLGSEVKLKTYLSENNQEYQRGSEYSLSFWGSYLLADQLAASIRLEHKAVDPIMGEDEKMGSMSPVLLPNLQHGQRTFVHLGTNYIMNSGDRLAFEYGTPLAFQVSGPQMIPNSIVTLAWQKAF